MATKPPEKPPLDVQAVIRKLYTNFDPWAPPKPRLRVIEGGKSKRKTRGDR